MSQTLTFGKAVEQLYFNVDVTGKSPDSIINEFDMVAQEHHVSKPMSSLSVNMDMDAEGTAWKVSHTFKFSKGPLPNMANDSGYIKIGVGEIGDRKKIIEIEWCFRFQKELDAILFFEELKGIFMPLSTKQRFEDDKINPARHAEFSTRNVNEKGVRDVTFSLGKAFNSSMYEIRFIPYNGYSK